MKKLITISSLIIILAFASPTNAQLARDSWAFGFGGSYPRFISVNTSASDLGYGGFLSLQRNFSEHVGLRLKGSFLHLEGDFTSPTGTNETTTTNVIGGDLDLMYYLIPCEPASPYLFGGGGAHYRMLDNYATPSIEQNKIGAQINGGFGVEWRLGEAWKLITEAGYHLTLNSDLDGALGVGEVNGKDTYLTASIGFQYIFSKGEPSRYCQLYTGISTEMPEPVDYARVEEIVKRYIPQTVEKQVVVEKPVSSMEKWVLIGVNFNFNSAKLTPESYPVLLHAAEVLLTHPDLRVEIQGYTDNVGSERYNQKLSEKRAQSIMHYLVSKGVSSSRLTAKGYGESNPIADNRTADGRAMNRRIEFRPMSN